MPDFSSEIAHLRRILDAGTRQVTADGLTTSYDLAAVRRRLAELESAHDGDPRTPLVRTRRQKLVPYRYSQ